MRVARQALIRGLKFNTQEDFEKAMDKLAKLDSASGGFIEFDLALDDHDRQVIIVSQRVYESLVAALYVIEVNFSDIGYNELRRLSSSVYHRHRRLFSRVNVPWTT